MIGGCLDDGRLIGHGNVRIDIPIVVLHLLLLLLLLLHLVLAVLSNHLIVDNRLMRCRLGFIVIVNDSTAKWFASGNGDLWTGGTGGNAGTTGF